MVRQVSIDFSDAGRKSWKFEGLRESLEFFKEEARYWKEKRQDLLQSLGSSYAPNEKLHAYINSAALLDSTVNTLQSWETQSETWSNDQVKQEQEKLRTSYTGKLNTAWLWSGHPYTGIFIDCNKQHGKIAATAFLELILNKKSADIVNGQAFFGVMLAYEFLFQYSDLTKRRNSEEVALDHLRNQLASTTSTLIGEAEKFKQEFQEWIDSSSIEHKKNEQAREDVFCEYMAHCKAKIEELEHLYQEKLRLEKPATYWNQSAKKHGRQGSLWASALVASVVLGLYYLHDFFISWLMGQQVDLKLQNIQGVVIFGSILTIYAFLVKTLSRLTFSSFHLMRDAEEREQLTYLYLALNQEKQIDEKSRNIILQALFSRSETGLLASESGPTMPVIGDFLKSEK